MWGTSVFLGTQSHPSSGMSHPKRGRALASPIFWGPPIHARHSMRKKTIKCCLVIELDVRKTVTGRSRMLTRDLFAVANLLLVHVMMMTTKRRLLVGLLIGRNPLHVSR